MTIQSDSVKFFWYDYFIMVLVLLISTTIGIYFGWFQKKAQTVKEYLKGENKMAALPIGFSVAVRFVLDNCTTLSDFQFFLVMSTVHL